MFSFCFSSLRELFHAKTDGPVPSLDNYWPLAETLSPTNPANITVLISSPVCYVIVIVPTVGGYNFPIRITNTLTKQLPSWLLRHILYAGIFGLLLIKGCVCRTFYIQFIFLFVFTCSHAQPSNTHPLDHQANRYRLTNKLFRHHSYPSLFPYSIFYFKDPSKIFSQYPSLIIFMISLTLSRRTGLCLPGSKHGMLPTLQSYACGWTHPWGGTGGHASCCCCTDCPLCHGVAAFHAP